jgi:hypothetical protein
MFNVRPDADLPGFRVGQHLPGFRVGIDSSIPRTFAGDPGSASTGYGPYADVARLLGWRPYAPGGRASNNAASQPPTAKRFSQGTIDVDGILAANPYLNAAGRLASDVAMLGSSSPANFLLNGHARPLGNGRSNDSPNPMSGPQLAADRPYEGSNEPYRHHVCTEAAYSCIEDSPLGERGLKWRADCQAAEDMCNQLLNHSRTNPFLGPRDTNVMFPNRGYIRIPPGARGEGAYVPPPQRR